MTSDLTLYTNPMSRGRIARWMMEEVGRPYETVLLDYGTTMKAADYLAVNPMGKVPALRHGDVVVTETAAICAYLADAFPAAGLAPPAGDPARGAYFRWLFFAAGPLEAAVTAKAMDRLAPPERAAMAGYGRFGDVMDALESAVSTDRWLCGDRFTAADLYVGAHIGWGLMFGSIDKRPAFERFAARAAGREAAKRANALDDADVAKVAPPPGATPPPPAGMGDRG